MRLAELQEDRMTLDLPKCTRCGGMLSWETFSDNTSKFDGARCINCGAVTDLQIEENKRLIHRDIKMGRSNRTRAKTAVRVEEPGNVEEEAI